MRRLPVVLDAHESRNGPARANSATAVTGVRGLRHQIALQSARQVNRGPAADQLSPTKPEDGKKSLREAVFSKVRASGVPPAASAWATAVAAPMSSSVGFTNDERLFWWSNLSKVVRIQRWARRWCARRSVTSGLGQRKAALDLEYRGECAEMVQRAWRTYQAKKMAVAEIDRLIRV